jgi:hypothetical protein
MKRCARARVLFMLIAIAGCAPLPSASGPVQVSPPPYREYYTPPNASSPANSTTTPTTTSEAEEAAAAAAEAIEGAEAGVAAGAEWSVLGFPLPTLGESSKEDDKRRIITTKGSFVYDYASNTLRYFNIKLAGLGFGSYDYDNWILDSEPRGAVISGLSFPAVIRTAVKVQNLSKDVIDLIIASAPGYQPCVYTSALHTDVEYQGIHWTRLLCELVKNTP